MTNNNADIFKSPIRDTAKTRDYVDYTPRRRQFLSAASSSIDLAEHEIQPNQISYAKERRTNYYHQLAMEQSNETTNFMDSPVVVRHFGFTQSIRDHQQLQKPTKFKIKKEAWTTNDFNVIKNVGVGKFGVVYQVVEIQSQKVVALKVLNKNELEMATVVPFLKREIEIQSHLEHPNIVQLYGYFHDKENVYLVMEYTGENDLYSLLSRAKRFTEQEAMKYIVQLIRALKYMHGVGVIHRDLKLENILITDQGELKIADFGWAVYDPRPRRNTFCGTLDYLPPEMIKNGQHGHGVDIWALGIIYYELLVGIPPFWNETEENPQKTYQKIIDDKIVFPTYVSIQAQQFILKLLNKDPMQRVTIKQIELDAYFKSFL